MQRESHLKFSLCCEEQMKIACEPSPVAYSYNNVHKSGCLSDVYL